MEKSLNILKAKTGFESSTEGKQEWPPKTFKIHVVESNRPLTDAELEECKVPINYPDTYNPLIPFSTP